jgi:integrase/recombinase XerD
VNRSVNLTKRIKTPDGLRFCPVVHSANGRVKADHVEIAGREERHPEGSYYIEWYEDGKRLRRSVGKHALAADAQRHQQEEILVARAAGLKAGLKFVDDTGKILLSKAVTTYLADILLGKSKKTYAAYSKDLEYFTESCTKTYLADVDRRDMLRYSAFLRDEKELAPRTVSNKFENVISFLKAQGIRGLVGKNDWPSYTEEEPEIYDREELDKLFAACDAEERMWFEFFLMTGEREQEVSYTYWSDINFAASTVRVSHKPDRGWTPKAYKEREIPVPDKLMKSLQAWKKSANKTCPLLFPTAGCNPKLDFLDCLKDVAKRAGLNCKHCDTCKNNDKCEHWFLHKFRATFATWASDNNVSVPTVMLWLGHSDSESTMRYLKPARGPKMREKMNEIFT